MPGYMPGTLPGPRKVKQLRQLRCLVLDFPGGAVDKNLPAEVRDTGSIPVLGRSHMPWGN